MHGDMPQKERDEIMAQFREGKSRVLIATDIWGRGLDVQQVMYIRVCYELLGWSSLAVVVANASL